MVTKKVPMRQCTGCREMKSKRDMIRVIKTAENEICIDATGRMNGRGPQSGLTAICRWTEAAPNRSRLGCPGRTVPAPCEDGEHWLRWRKRRLPGRACKS